VSAAVVIETPLSIINAASQLSLQAEERGDSGLAIIAPATARVREAILKLQFRSMNGLYAASFAVSIMQNNGLHREREFWRIIG
jgi:hypothetical protein